ncbi:hypothetical protein [Flavobacterium sp.]|uniref:hypothetical protein n=1 Tax=Flavobacterium sp. TaxID=239 RepID=UPI0025DD09FB|nr:hypothetical protein [Flavobacterium sp.]
MANTISFDEKNNGWTSMWSYKPEWMSRLGDNFYSFKKGQLFRHHSEVSPKNFFYNEDGVLTNHDSTITFAFNQDPSDVKHFKTISLESSDNNWDVELKSTMDSGYISSSHFQTREGEHYAFIRRNEADSTDFHHISVQGLGTPISRSENTYTFNSLPSFLSEEDCLYFVKPSDSTIVKVGKLVSFDLYQLTTITPNPSITIENNAFYFIAKNAEAESYGIKGYVLEVKLTSTGEGTPQDLYSVNAEVFKSFQ